MLRRLFLFLGLAALLLLESCAALKPPPPVPPPAPSPAPPPSLPSPAPEPLPHARKFPDFVAVIARPGDTFASLAAEYLQDPSLGWFIADFNEIASLEPGRELVIPLQPPEKGGLTFHGYQTIPVIVYHRFSKNTTDRMTVRESAFEEQMRFLRDDGYRVIPLEDLFRFLDSRGRIPPKSAVITIDEEWRSTYEVAFPILKRYGYPATFFAYTDYMNARGWELLREMSRNGMDVQGHTKTHRNLIKRKPGESFRGYFEAVEKELAESAQVIKKQMNKEVKYLAYPYGDTNPLTIALLKKLGYRGAVTVKRGSAPFFSHPYRVNRSMIYGDFTLQDFKKNLVSFSDQRLR